MNRLNSKILKAKKIQQIFFYKILFFVVSIIFISFFIYFFLAAKKVIINPSVRSYYLDIVDGNALFLFKRILFLSNSIVIKVSSPGYDSYQSNYVSKNLDVINIYLTRQISSININTNVVVGENNWFLNDKLISNDRRLTLKIIPDIYKLRIENRFYQTKSLEIDFKKDINKKNYNLILNRLKGNLKIVTYPENANITINEKKLGKTPIDLELLAGAYSLNITKKGYQKISSKVEIDNLNIEKKINLTLKPEKVNVTINLLPIGGDLFINNVIINDRDKVSLNAKKKYKIIYKKKGYKTIEKNYSFLANKDNEIRLSLEKEFGEIKIKSEPNGIIIINEKNYGNTPKKIKLQTTKQNLKIIKEGYVTFQKEILTKPYELSVIDIKLEKEIAKVNRLSKKVYTNSIGIKLKLFTPSNFIMGAPRHEKGQRANEFIKEIILRKRFYASLTEITIAQYMNFKNKTHLKNNKNLPISNVTWLDAIMFCNWLSMKEGLDQVYLFDSKNYIGANLQSNGYRLPTEAEWEWLARKAERNTKTKFSWGKTLPIPKMSGNLADESVIGLQESYIPNYKDNYKYLAPVSSYKKDISGLFDLTGNVKEWVHDYYLVSVPKDNMVYYDPSGPKRGVGHVVKGSSYLSATLQEVRASYRDSEVLKKEDIGFRIVRYLFGKEFKNDEK